MSLDKFKISAKAVEKQAKTLFKHLDPGALLEITLDDNVCRVNVETETSGLLIGRHGETLEALQHILRLMLAKECEEFIPLSLDIAGYRELRAREVEEMAKKAAQKVIAFGGEVALPPMGAYDRRLVHVALQGIEGVEGISEGEEPYRRIVIRPSRK